MEVQDSGVGIDDKYLSDLFTPFSQEDMGYTRKFDGNGIGLSLVKTWLCHCDFSFTFSFLWLYKWASLKL